MKFDNLNMRSSEVDSDNDDAISVDTIENIHTYSIIIIAIYFTAMPRIFKLSNFIWTICESAEALDDSSAFECLLCG